MIRKGTLIETYGGPKPIEEITKDDLVLSFDFSTGELAYSEVSLITRKHVKGTVAKVNDTFISGFSFVMDHEMDEEVIIDGSGILIHPKLNNLCAVNETLEPLRTKVEFLEDECDYYAIAPKKDVYFANGIMMSNGGSMTVTKSPYGFLTENKEYRRKIVEPDENVKELYRKYDIDQKVIDTTMIRFIPNSLLFCKQSYCETLYRFYLRRIDFLFGNIFIGERVL